MKQRKEKNRSKEQNNSLCNTEILYKARNSVIEFF